MLSLKPLGQGSGGFGLMRKTYEKPTVNKAASLKMITARIPSWCEADSTIQKCDPDNPDTGAGS